MHHSATTAVCRGCGLVLEGKPYGEGGSARIPGTRELAKRNYYGGYVCSEGCDRRACLELEQSMPGHGCKQTRVSDAAMRRIRENWSDA